MEVEANDSSVGHADTSNYAIPHDEKSKGDSSNIPTTSDLSHIYTEDALQNQKARWKDLLAKFEEKYGRKADFVSRSPGRVNLIGEHIDYSLYAVLPMAVEVDVILAVSTQAKEKSESSPQVRVANVDTSKFPDRTFDIPTDGKDVEIDAEAHEWSNYFKAGFRGVASMLREKKGRDYVPVGMDVMVHGTVPSGGGLSSSAAFVCAASLAVLKANGIEEVGKKELVELAMVAERAVGVNSGGMDQSASVFGQRGSALYVSFKPELAAEPVSFPDTDPELTVVVAQSFVAADKHVTAPIHYNLRVVECSLAATFMARIFGIKDLPKDQGPLGISLRGFHDTYFERKEGVEDNTKTNTEDFVKQLEKLITMVEDYLPQEEGYSREQICDMLALSREEFRSKFESQFPVRAETFKLRQRALHVFKEALRVFTFKDLLASSQQGEDGGKALLQELGGLMNDTQESCRDVYECSCPELDELCRLARSAGSYGSRLTGAGWGGCSVHLVPKDKVEKVKKSWVDNYYRKKWPDISDDRLQEAIVVSKPSSGAYVYTVGEGSL